MFKNAQRCYAEGAGQRLVEILGSGVGLWPVSYLFIVIFMFYLLIQIKSYVYYIEMGESGGTTSSTRRRGAGYMHHDSWVATPSTQVSKRGSC